MPERRILTWLMPSIADVLFLRFLYNALTSGSRLLNDGDTGWHIVTGESILSNWKIPHSDPYSHTMPGTSWTTHEWLSEVVLAAAHRLAGLNGVVVLSSVVLAGTFFLLYVYMFRRGVNPLTAAFLTIIATWVATLHWLARPHIFSMALTLAFLAILRDYQRQGIDRLKFLPPLMILWVNLHGGFVFGLVLLGVYTFGNLLISFSRGKARLDGVRAWKRLRVIFLLTFLATLLNPVGPAILLFPFHLVGRQYIMDNVSEWMSPNFHTYRALAYLIVLFIAVFVFSKRRANVFEIALTLLLLNMSFYSVRYVPLLAIVVTPFAAPLFEDGLKRLARFFSGNGIAESVRDFVQGVAGNAGSLEHRFNRHFWPLVATVLCVLIALNGGRLGRKQVMDYRHDKERFPVEALAFALQNGVSGNMFNNDGWGGYIIYASYPTYRVFMDGRSDMYDVPLLKEYIKVASAQLGYEQVLDKYKVTWVLFNANSPLCQLLVSSGRWKLIYADKTANVLLRESEANRELIESHRGIEFEPKPDGS